MGVGVGVSMGVGVGVERSLLVFAFPLHARAHLSDDCLRELIDQTAMSPRVSLAGTGACSRPRQRGWPRGCNRRRRVSEAHGQPTTRMLSIGGTPLASGTPLAGDYADAFGHSLCCVLWCIFQALAFPAGCTIICARYLALQEQGGPGANVQGVRHASIRPSNWCC